MQLSGNHGTVPSAVAIMYRPYRSSSEYNSLSYTIGIDQDTSAPRQFGTSPKSL